MPRQAEGAAGHQGYARLVEQARAERAILLAGAERARAGGEDIKGAIGHRAFDPRHGVQGADHLVPAGAERGAALGQEPARAAERRKGGGAECPA